MPTRAHLASTLLLALAGLGACKPDPTVTPEYQATVAEARKAGEELDKERREAIGKAKGAIVPRADLGSCPVDVKLPNLQFKAIMPNQVKITMMTAKPALDVIEARQADTMKGPTLEYQKTRIEMLDGDAKRGEPGVVAKAKEMGTPAWFDVDLVVVVDSRTDPELSGDKEFKSGELVGRAYLWSYKDHAIVCAASVSVESSDTVSVGGSSPEYLRGDLDAQAIIQARKRLMRAGPPLAVAPMSSASALPSAAVAPKKPAK